MLDFIKKQLNQYLKDPDLQHFLELRSVYLKSSGYSPYGAYKQIAYRLLDDEQYPEALQYLRSVLPGWLLNPGIHRTFAYTYHKLSRPDEESLESSLANLLLRGIQSTGNGTEQRPYLVLYVEDEYEILESIGMKPHLQQLVVKESCSFDVQSCETGEAIWFDVTAMRDRLAKKLRAEK
jgi:hypothetical protein